MKRIYCWVNSHLGPEYQQQHNGNGQLTTREIHHKYVIRMYRKPKDVSANKITDYRFLRFPKYMQLLLVTHHIYSKYKTIIITRKLLSIITVFFFFLSLYH